MVAVHDDNQKRLVHAEHVSVRKGKTVADALREALAIAEAKKAASVGVITKSDAQKDIDALMKVMNNLSPKGADVEVYSK